MRTVIKYPKILAFSRTLMWHPLCFKSFGREVSLNIAAAGYPKCAVFNRFWNEKSARIAGRLRQWTRDDRFTLWESQGFRGANLYNAKCQWIEVRNWFNMIQFGTLRCLCWMKGWSFCFFLLLTLPVWHQAQFSFWSQFFEQKHPDWTFVLLSSDVNCWLFHGLGSFIPVARWRGQLGCGDIGDQQSWKGVRKATFFEALPWR